MILIVFNVYCDEKSIPKVNLTLKSSCYGSRPHLCPYLDTKPNIFKIFKVIVRVIDSYVYWDEKSIAQVYLTIKRFCYDSGLCPCPYRAQNRILHLSEVFVRLIDSGVFWVKKSISGAIETITSSCDDINKLKNISIN